jgi:hypothetical protein
MAHNPVDRIVRMLADEAVEKRIAAALVLGELGVKSSPAITGLRGLLREDSAPLRRHGLEALTKVGAASKVLDDILPLLGARDEDVRTAAVEAVASAGDGVLSHLKARVEDAGPVERRAIDSILSRLGGKEAFGALLERLASDASSARSVAIEMRGQIKAADGTTRRSYRAQLEKYLARYGKDADRTDSVAAALKVLGYLEDDRTVPLLIGYAKDPKRAPQVRQEALIAMRFALGQKAGASKVVEALVRAAEDDDRTLAQTAIMTLATLPMTPKIAESFLRLAAHPDISRANIAIQKLGSETGDDATDALIEVIGGGDGQRADLATDALRRKLADEPAAVIGKLAAALTKVDDAERARRLRGLILPHVTALPPKDARALVTGSVRAAADGRAGWREAVDVAMRADPNRATSGLREVAAALRKGRKTTREREVLGALVRADRATDDDRYRVASLELAESKLDTRPAARRGDHAIQGLERLARSEFDLVAALRKDRSLALEQLYYVGFHFIEGGSSLGEELLEEVVAKAGRKKIGKAAKNKLKLAGLAE